MPLVSAENVKAYYHTSGGSVKAVDGIDLRVNRGEILGIVGESGCGKSTLASTLMMNVRPPLKFVEGKISVDKYELPSMRRKEIRSKIWGNVISIVPQSALNALIPIKKTKDIIKDVLKRHLKNLSTEEINNLAKKRFQELDLPTEVLAMYPHELSGGMKQRAVIATSTLLNPKLLIVDEPTSALDVSTQKIVLKMILDLRTRGIIESVVFITHDIAILRQISDRITVMYAGKIVESSTADEILENPIHPYSKGLINAVITPEREVKKRGLSYIHGQPPNLLNPPIGCRFYPRCELAKDICREQEPNLTEVSRDHFVACHFP